MTASVGRFRNCVIVGAGGRAGGMFLNLMAGHVDRVFKIDTQPVVGGMVDDITTPSQQLIDELSNSDLVILAVPDAILPLAMRNVLETLGPDSLIVDCGSIKSPLSEISTGSGPGLLSLNPLFGPDLDPAGRRIAVCRLRQNALSDVFERILKCNRLSLVVMDVETHDRAAAVNQATLHLMLLCFASLAHDPKWSGAPEFQTPPFRLAMQVAARTLFGGNPMQWAIQTTNPYAAEAREDFVDQLRHLSDRISDGDKGEFDAFWQTAHSGLEPGLDALLCEAKSLYADCKTLAPTLGVRLQSQAEGDF